MEGPCASCAHEDGEEAGVDDTHEVGEEADMGGGGQQTCIAEVTYAQHWPVRAKPFMRSSAALATSLACPATST